MPSRMHAHWFAVSDDIYIGPSELAPGPNETSKHVAQLVLLPLIAIFGLIILVFYVMFFMTAVDGDSMVPTLLHGDRLLVTKGYENPERGDLVIFELTNSKGVNEDLVKRVVGLPGDTISVEGGVATVNGIRETTGGLTIDENSQRRVDPLVVPPDTLYVMGDNRPISLDSRSLGPVPFSAFKGKAVLLIFPFSRAASLR